MDLQKEMEANQEEICKLCEAEIIGCKHSTSTFLCEGRFCDEAVELFNEEKE
jgi:hypothetical protein